MAEQGDGGGSQGSGKGRLSRSSSSGSTSRKLSFNAAAALAKGKAVAAAAGEKGKSAAAAASDKGKAVAAVASDKGKEAAAAVSQAASKGWEWAKEHGNEDFMDFLQNPSIEKLAANPALLSTALTIMTAVKHPKAAALSALVNSKAKTDALAAATAGAKDKVTDAVAGELVSQSGGVLPKDAVKDAVGRMSKEEMLQAVQLMKTVGPYLK